MKRKRLVFSALGCFLMCLSVASYAQVFESSVPLVIDSTDYNNLSTPYHTTLTFFYNLQEETFDPDKSGRALDMSREAGEKAPSLAVKLKQVFDGRGVYVRIGEIPMDPNFVDTLRNGQTRYFFDEVRLPGVFLEKVGRKWLFSSYTVSQIEQLHVETYPLGTDRLLNQIPKIGNDVYFGLHLWQLVGMFVLLLLIFVSYKIFTVIVDRGVYYLLMRAGYGKTAKKYLLPVARVVSIYFIVLLLAIFLRVLQLPISIVSWVTVLLNAVKPLLVTIIFYKLVDLLSSYLENMASRTTSTLDDQLVPLIRKTLKTFVIVVGTLFILKDGLQLDIVPFLTGLSIGGLAFALAAQDTIRNFFGSVMIFIDKPFQVGDWITSGDVDGTVEEVGFRSTRVRTFRDSLVYIPNGKIADATIDNHGLRKYRRFSTHFMVAHGTPPELIEVFTEGLREMVKRHPSTRKDFYHVYLNNLSPHSLDIMFYVFFEVPTWAEELKAREDMLLGTIRLANQLGVRFAFPTQTLHIETFPEKASLRPIYEDEKEAYQKRLDQFIAKELGTTDTN